MAGARAAWLVALVAAPLIAAAPSPLAQREIAGLMDALSASGCEFQRNGSWYRAAEARRHLQRKYDYLLKRDLVDSAERFIELAASRSSMSGRAYRVRCPGREAQDAGPWFREKLEGIRASPTPVRRPS